MLLRIPLIVALSAVSLQALSTAQEQAKPSPSVDKWEKTIAGFEAKDKESPPPKDAILFVGSSSIVGWDVKKSFPDLVTINRGFGGSQMSDVVRHARRVISPYKPRAIVLYEGDNDLASGKSPQEVANSFDELLKLVRADLPTTPLVVIGSNPSPKRWSLIEKQRELNRLLAARCEQDGHATFLDVEQAMLAADGKPQAEIFKADQLHMNPAGYEIWTALLRPILDKHASAAKSP
jgi:lysophospholipase L1-like esterase